VVRWDVEFWSLRQNCSLKIWVCDRSDQTISFTGDCLSQGKICVFSIANFRRMSSSRLRQ